MRDRAPHSLCPGKALILGKRAKLCRSRITRFENARSAVLDARRLAVVDRAPVPVGSVEKQVAQIEKAPLREPFGPAHGKREIRRLLTERPKREYAS